MFFHKFKYTFKFLFRNKMLVFWTFLFPIVLGLCFYLAFKDIESNEMLDIINIAVVDNDNYNNSINLKESLKYLSDESSEDRLFDIKYVDLEEAKKLLEEKEIDGYLYIDDNPNIVVNKNGINETIFKYVIDEIYSNNLIINDYMKDTSDYNILLSKINKLSENEDFTINNTNENISYTMIEYYTLIAMSALYSGMFAITVINNEMANISSIGKRNSISPISKLKSVIGSLSASYVVSLIGLLLLFIFTILVIHVDYGNNLPRVILIGVLGTLAGLSLGIFVGTFIKGNENSKNGVLLSLTMLGSFFSGMMGITMKYIIDTNVKIINMINPAAMITDGLYSLYYFDTYTRFNKDVISLLLFSSILIALSILKVRRVKYDSI